MMYGLMGAIGEKRVDRRSPSSDKCHMGYTDDQPSYRQGTGREWSEWRDGGGGTGVGRAGEIVVVRAVSVSCSMVWLLASY